MQKGGKLAAGVLLLYEECSEELRKQPYVNLEELEKEEKNLVEKYKEKIHASRKRYEKNSPKAVTSSDKTKTVYWVFGSLAVIIIAGIVLWLIKKHKQKSR